MLEDGRIGHEGSHRKNRRAAILNLHCAESATRVWMSGVCCSLREFLQRSSASRNPLKRKNVVRTIRTDSQCSHELRLCNLSAVFGHDQRNWWVLRPK